MTPDLPSRGFGTYLALALLLLTSAPVWIGKLADDATPLGLDPDTWVYLTAATAIALVLGRAVQAALGIWAARQTDPASKGLGTIVGVSVTALAGLPAVLQELAGAAGPLNVDPAVFAKAAVAVGIATTVSRYLQGAIVALNVWRAGGTPELPAP